MWVPFPIILKANADVTAGGVFHDPEAFPEPGDFNPERWLRDDMKSDRTYDLVFGTARVRVYSFPRFYPLLFCGSEFVLGYTLRGIQSWVVSAARRSQFSSNISQDINAMKLIWAFKFSKSKDPATNQDKVYDLGDFVKVGPARSPRVC